MADNNPGAAPPQPQPQTPPQHAGDSFRGPLKYSVETATPQLVAGRNTSVFLLITNPYDVSVEIISAETKIPAGFRRVTQSDGFLRRTFANEFEVVSGQPLHQDTPATEGKGTDADRSAPGDPVCLCPGNTTIREFNVKTAETYMFSPATYSLNAEIQYRMDNMVNRDVFRYQLSIRPPLKAIICGGVCGAVLGGILRAITEVENEISIEGNVWLNIVVGMLVASVLVVAFARKKDAQPFITVEDFWGGFFIGVVAGYTGKSMLAPVLNVATQAGATPPPAVP